MANLKVLIILRYFFIVLSAAFAACTIAFAVKSLKDVKASRKLIKSVIPTAELHVEDMTRVVYVCIVAGIVGVIVSIISEVFLAIERRKGIAAAGRRYLNEALLLMSSLFLFGAAIAGTIVAKGSAVITIPDMTPALVATITAPQLKARGRSLAYKDSWSWKAIIMTWCAFATVTITLLLVAAAGIHYRRNAVQQTQTAFHTERREEDDMSEKVVTHHA